MYNTLLVYCCDVVRNLLVEVENFNFFIGLFVYLFVCTSRLAKFAKANGPIMRKYAFEERIDGIFALAESLPTPATRIWAYLELTRSF